MVYSKDCLVINNNDNNNNNNDITFTKRQSYIERKYAWS